MAKDGVAAVPPCSAPQPDQVMSPRNMLMELPLELRELIYEYALQQEEPAVYISRYTSYITLRGFPMRRPPQQRQSFQQEPQKFMPALLFASAQLNTDALPSFLRRNTIRLTANFHVDAFLAWLRDVNGFNHIRSLELPYFEFSFQGRTGHDLLGLCPNLAKLTMHFSMTRLDETTTVTGPSAIPPAYLLYKRHGGCFSPGRRSDDFAQVLAFQPHPQRLDWRVKLERIRTLTSLTQLELCVSAPDLHDLFACVDAEEGLKRLKAWFDAGFGGRVEVSTKTTTKNLSDVNCDGAPKRK